MELQPTSTAPLTNLKASIKPTENQSEKRTGNRRDNRDK